MSDFDDLLTERQHQHALEMLRLAHNHAAAEAESQRFADECRELAGYARQLQETHDIEQAADREQANTLSERRCAELRRAIEEEQTEERARIQGRLIKGTGRNEDGSPMVKRGEKPFSEKE